MNRQTASYVIGIGLIVLTVVFVLVFLATRDPAPKNQSNTPTNKSKTLQEYANTDATVIYTIDGKIQANELHQSIRITVNKNSRVLDVITGFQGQVTSSSSFGNNSEAYGSFLSAIDKAGYSKQKPDTQNQSINGQCPLGLRYTYNANSIENFPTNLWSTNCNTKNGTFGGNPLLVRQLFQLQIPNYGNLTSSVRLN